MAKDPKPAALDPRSARVVLTYTGNNAGEPSIASVPARDLTENDLCRLLLEQGGKLDQADPFIAALIATGLYTPTSKEP
jgi:hypothetical protein